MGNDDEAVYEECAVVWRMAWIKQKPNIQRGIYDDEYYYLYEMYKFEKFVTPLHMCSL